MTSAQGQDRSAFQEVYGWGGLDFGFAKATNGLGGTDPVFAANWANLAHANIPRGAYHELTASASAEAQAAFFVATVKEHGLRPKDMLAIVASDYAGVTDAMVRAALDETHALAGPHCPVLCYTDLSFAGTLTSCGGYGLWATHPSSTAPGPAGPWRTWRFWQWSITDPVDLDAYNGTAAELHAWLSTFEPSPPPAPVLPLAAYSQEDNVMLLTPGTLTPLAIPPGTGKLLFVTIFGTTPDWQTVKVGIAWHGARTMQYVVVNPNQVWPAATVPTGVAGCTLSIVEGDHLVSVALIPASAGALPDTAVLQAVAVAPLDS